MGWAIRRSDGSYRCWNRNAQDDVLRPEEVETWVEMAEAPEISAPSGARPTISPSVTPDDLMQWMRDELNAVRVAVGLPEVDLAEARRRAEQTALRKGG